MGDPFIPMKLECHTVPSIGKGGGQWEFWWIVGTSINSFSHSEKNSDVAHISVLPGQGCYSTSPWGVIPKDYQYSITYRGRELEAT